MRRFMDKDFLLSTETAKGLFHGCASGLPIIDYHCHLSPKEIWEDTVYENITQLWLYGDHYKWRAMRWCGVGEEYITGNKSDYQRFEAFASILPLAVGNPLYHWAHLELQRYFKIEQTLSKETAKEIWDKTSKMLASGNYSVRRFIEMSNVETLCTTDDPADSLQYHKAIKAEGRFKTKVLPTFRPDKAIQIGAEAFDGYIRQLSEASGIPISDVDGLMAALYARADYFARAGCVISDHAFAHVPYVDYDSDKANSVFKKRMSGQSLSGEECDGFATYVLTELAAKYKSLGWAMQLHIGAIRNNNKIMFQKLGPDTGFDSVMDANIAQNLSRLLGGMDAAGRLPKTILYTLNPKDYYVLATMCGNFQGADAMGKVQLGTAWWFCDHLDGMREQMRVLASLGVLGTFIGMLTDSRSFLSYPRHEYFRRILCDLLGSWVENGQYPNDKNLLSQMVKGICYNNVKKYLGL